MKKTFITLFFCILLNFSLIFAKNANKSVQNYKIQKISSFSQPVLAENPIPFDYFDYLDLISLYFGVEVYLA